MAICASCSDNSCWSALEFETNPGVAIVVLFVGFEGVDVAGRVGGAMIIDGTLEIALFSPRTEGSVELSEGESRRSSVGSDILDGVSIMTCVTGSIKGGRVDMRCSSGVISGLGIGMVDKIGCC